MAKAMSETTIHKDNYAAWCHANDKTLINGSKIYTGSITADKINVNSLETICAKIGYFSIENGVLKAITDSDTTTAIVVGANVSNGTISSQIYPRGIAVQELSSDRKSGSICALRDSDLTFSTRSDGTDTNLSSYGRNGCKVFGNAIITGELYAGRLQGTEQTSARTGVIKLGNMAIVFGHETITTGTTANNGLYSGSTDISFGVTFKKTPAILTNWSGNYVNMHSTGSSSASTTGASVWGRTTTASTERTIQWVAIGEIE